MSCSNRPFRAFALLAACALAPGAFAGPPLICEPFATDSGAPLLPWGEGSRWHQPDSSYDRATLVADTLELLSPDAPILARMENMRRAAIYADGDPALAAALLEAVVERTESRPDDARAEALEWFDAAYLVETYRQLDLVHEHRMLPRRREAASLVPAELAALDGYALVQKAAALAPELLAELEFASGLMSPESSTTKHLSAAAALAGPGSLLAQNLAQHGVR